MADTERKYQHHPVAFKRELVEASLKPGVSMAALARQHGVNANQLWAWRKLYNEGRLEAATSAVPATEAPTALLAVDVIESRPAMVPAAASPGALEIVIGSARLSVTGRIDPELLKTAITALRA